MFPDLLKSAVRSVLTLSSALLVLLASPSQDPSFRLDELSRRFDFLSIAMFWVDSPISFTMVISFPMPFPGNVAHWTARTDCIHPG